jgi:hypothetical protein
MKRVSNIYRPGDRIYDCERCGLTRRVSELRRETNIGAKGLVVCIDTCFDGPHPRDTPIKNRGEGKIIQIK